MATKFKNVYTLWFPTSLGLGAQPVKGNTLKEAKARFKKRYPAKRIMNGNRTTDRWMIQQAF
jgi:hypothetical protein